MFDSLIELGHGGEGTVYKKDEKALKIFKTRESESISRELQEIKLRQIVTPDEIVTDESGEYLGYTMKLFDHPEDVKKINKKDLLESFEILKEDLIVLSQELILASDLIPRNSIYQDNKLYLIDTSVYMKANCDAKTAERINYGALRNFIRTLVETSTGSLYGRKNLSKQFSDYVSLIKEQMGETETVEAFAKRLVKN